MRFIEFGHIDSKGKFQEACGDRSIVILDGRNSISTSMADARQYNGYRRPVYGAYRICQGETLCRSNPITNVITL